MKGKGFGQAFHRIKHLVSQKGIFQVDNKIKATPFVNSAVSLLAADCNVIMLTDQTINDNAAVNTQKILACSLNTILMQ